MRRGMPRPSVAMSPCWATRVASTVMKGCPRPSAQTAAAISWSCAPPSRGPASARTKRVGSLRLSRPSRNCRTVKAAPPTDGRAAGERQQSIAPHLIGQDLLAVVAMADKPVLGHRAYLLDKFGHEAALADAGLADESDEPAAAGRRRFHGLQEARKLLLSADERRFRQG